MAKAILLHHENTLSSHVNWDKRAFVLPHATLNNIVNRMKENLLFLNEDQKAKFHSVGFNKVGSIYALADYDKVNSEYTRVRGNYGDCIAEIMDLDDLELDDHNCGCIDFNPLIFPQYHFGYDVFASTTIYHATFSYERDLQFWVKGFFNREDCNNRINSHPIRLGQAELLLNELNELNPEIEQELEDEFECEMD